MSISLLKILSVTGTVLGVAGTLISDYVGKAETDEKIKEAVAEAIKSTVSKD